MSAPTEQDVLAEVRREAGYRAALEAHSALKFELDYKPGAAAAAALRADYWERRFPRVLDGRAPGSRGDRWVLDLLSREAKARLTAESKRAAGQAQARKQAGAVA